MRELHIVNLAVLADATVELAPGLNVFTGETGAGKSLIMGAFELLLGLRSGGETGSAFGGVLCGISVGFSSFWTIIPRSGISKKKC